MRAQVRGLHGRVVERIDEPQEGFNHLAQIERPSYGVELFVLQPAMQPIVLASLDPHIREFAACLLGLGEIDRECPPGIVDGAECETMRVFPHPVALAHIPTFEATPHIAGVEDRRH